MSDERVILTVDEAEAMLPKGDIIHTFRNVSGILLGSDWSRKSVIEAIESHRPELSGAVATSMKHGIVLQDSNGALFIETVPNP